MSAPLSTMAGLLCGTVLQADREQALTRRFIQSRAHLSGKSSLGGGLTAAGLEAARDCGMLAIDADKALELVVEEARVRAAQLEAYATLLEREAEDGEDGGVAALARALCFPRSAHAAVYYAALNLDSASLMHAVEAAVRIRDGIDPLRCTVSGGGLCTCQTRYADNHVSVCAVDADGDAVDCIEGNDVNVGVSVEGVSVTSVATAEAGVVEVTYRMHEGIHTPLSMSVCVCGSVLHGSPWIITSALGDSAVLADVAPERVDAFLSQLYTWLPRRGYTLLYRGSRDRMTARAFHCLCDGKGPTLVLVRCDKGWVFGGYAGASWSSISFRDRLEDLRIPRYVPSPGAFLFSVTGPYTDAPLQFPVVKAYEALVCDASHGPEFNGGLVVRSSLSSLSAAYKFDEYSSCAIEWGTYRDVLGKGNCSLTGAVRFTPTEVEVFAVEHL